MIGRKLAKTPTAQNAAPLNRLLVLEDERPFGELLVQAACKRSIEARLATSCSEFLEIYAVFNPNMLVLDLFLRSEDCYPVLAYLSAQRCTAPLFFVSGYNRQWLNAVSEFAQGCGLLVADAIEKQHCSMDVLLHKLDKYRLK